MKPKRHGRLGARGLVVVGALLAMTAAGCSSGGGTGSSNEAASSAPKSSTSGSASLADMLPAKIRDAGQIVVSNPLSNPPYAFLDTDGTTLHGIAPDLSKALEPLLGVKFKWVNTPFPGLIPGLQSGKFDMIWGSITDTKKREEVIDFVDYEKDGAVLLVKAGNPAGIQDITSLCGKVASALSGSVQINLLSTQSDKCTSSGGKAIDVKVYQSVADAELAVRSGKVDAFFAGLGAALYQVKTAGGGTVYATAGPVYDAQVYGAGINKSDSQLSQAIQAGIKQLIKDGTYKKIFEKYGLGQAAMTSPDEVTINGGTT